VRILTAQTTIFTKDIMQPTTHVQDQRTRRDARLALDEELRRFAKELEELTDRFLAGLPVKARKLAGCRAA
jgi:uncharacterized protein YjiS (DUF1127 family)